METQTSEVKSAPSGADLVRNARARLQARDPRAAVAALKAALDSGERTAELMELLGVAQGMAGNTSAARHAFEEATKLEPSRATAHYNFALVLAGDGELEQAAEEASTAVYLDPNHAGAQKLRDQVVQQMRDRRYIGEQAFQTVGSTPSPEALRSGVLGGLTCGVCGKKNLFSARVCRHCGTFIKEMPDVVPVE
jgi:tetratricopeptide (TPR) repeat protein